MWAYLFFFKKSYLKYFSLKTELFLGVTDQLPLAVKMLLAHL